MNDPRYAAPVGQFSAAALPSELRVAIAELEHRFPGLGLALFVFDFGPSGGMSYISNANRDDMIAALTEWLRKQASRRN